LNEEDWIEATCQSLGFGAGAEESPATLVLVDNGSSDRTLQVSQAIAASSAAAVQVVEEPERGHVPARRRGNRTAADLAQMMGAQSTELLIIQCDADTIYSPGYIAAMTDYAERADRPDAMFQADTLPPASATSAPLVESLIAECDRLFEDRWGHQEFDMVVDDKACAYTLDSYGRWGGFKREFTGEGDEILAETTRLAMAGSVVGLKVNTVATAGAVHSTRRLDEDAVQTLASAGFPYVRRRLLPGYGLVPLLVLERRTVAGETIINEIIHVRRRHLAALLVVLPHCISRTLRHATPREPAVRQCLELIPDLSAADLRNAPGRLLADVLSLATAGHRLLDELWS
jgi:hypothetical protein